MTALLCGSWLLLVAVVALVVAAVGLALGWPGHVLIGAAGALLTAFGWEATR